MEIETRWGKPWRVCCNAGTPDVYVVIRFFRFFRILK
jgi:hypothetical protein